MNNELAYIARKARWYVERGYNPLPSKSINGRIRPSMRQFADLRDKPISPKILERWWAPGIQVCLGKRWNLCVIDLDGQAGRKEWRALSIKHGIVKTWAVQHNPLGGMHLWFRWPGDESLPFKTWIWQGENHHEAIELLGEHNLIVSPPTISPKSGNRYRWVKGCSPRDLERPAVLPEWVVETVRTRMCAPQPVRVPLRRLGGQRIPGRCPVKEVDEAIKGFDPVLLGKALGLRVAAEKPNVSGWVSCNSAFREDRNPSASITTQQPGGVYWEPGVKSLNFYDLAVAMGHASRWSDAVNLLGRIVGVHHECGNGERNGSQHRGDATEPRYADATCA